MFSATLLAVRKSFNNACDDGYKSVGTSFAGEGQAVCLVIN